MYVSQHLRSPDAREYLVRTQNLELLCNAVTSVINPSLYDAGLRAIQAIKASAPFHGHRTNLAHWVSVWSGYALIVNRETPPHRDSGSAPPTYDLLVSGGTHVFCDLNLPDIGTSLPYGPGTMVGLCGKVLRHSVMSWAGGERICSAHFMKDNVHNRLGEARPDWSCLSDYLS